jgi:hypothetical protein
LLILTLVVAEFRTGSGPWENLSALYGTAKWRKGTRIRIRDLDDGFPSVPRISSPPAHFKDQAAFQPAFRLDGALPGR